MVVLSIVLYIIFLSTVMIALPFVVAFGCGLAFVNPKYLYSRFRVNWFGAIMLSIIFLALTAPVTIWYWVYKLFTVGRRWDNG